MVALYFLYRDRLNDTLQAEETLHELERRFPNHPCMTDIYEDMRLQALRHDADYIARMRHMLAAQDSLYALTYDAYKHGRFAEVKSQIKNHKSQMTNDHWSLAPRFLFLNAVSVARTEGQEAFVEALQEMVRDYGTTELGTMAKEMLAMMGQGMESQKGGATGSLEDLRGKTQDTADEEEQKTQMEWSEDRKQPSVVLLILPQEDEQALNELLYEVALFNFSQFLIRDFDLQKMPVYKTTCALRVSGFADLDEAEWWIDLMQKNAEMQTRLEQIQIKAVTEVNLPLL